MSVKVTIGNLFEANVDAYINTVNCVGVMGKGVALEFKKRYPVMFDEYKHKCARKEVMLGKPYIWKSITPPHVINFPTKDHWRYPSSLNAIEAGLEYLLCEYKNWGITSIASPPLGCGQGQLDWRMVGPILFQGFSRLEIPIILFAPYGTSDEFLDRKFLRGVKRLDAGADSTHAIPLQHLAVVEIMKRLNEIGIQIRFDSIVFHKLWYLAYKAGVVSGLVFERESFGPFSKNLKSDHIISKLVNNGLLELTQSDKAIVHTVGKAYNSKAWKRDMSELDEAMEQVVDLFLRVTSPVQAELYSSVIYANDVIGSRTGQTPTEEQIIGYVSEWKKRREWNVTKKQIHEAIRFLDLLGWISVPKSDKLPEIDVSLVST